MNLKQVVILVVLIVSLVANAWLVNERLEGAFYRRGIAAGRKALAGQVVEQVVKTGKISVTTDEGEEIPLVRARPGLPGEIDAAKLEAAKRQQKYDAGLMPADLAVDGVIR